jgi:hypothetical protein
MKLVDIKHKTNPNLIRTLERLLAEAKTGEIRNIVYALSFENNDTSNGWAITDNNSIALIGELEVLKLQIIDNFTGIHDEYTE